MEEDEIALDKAIESGDTDLGECRLWASSLVYKQLLTFSYSVLCPVESQEETSTDELFPYYLQPPCSFKLDRVVSKRARSSAPQGYVLSR